MDSASTPYPDYDCASRGTYPDVPLCHVKAFLRAFRESLSGKESRRLVTSEQKGCSWRVLQTRTFCGLKLNFTCTVVMCLMLESSAVLWLCV